MKRTIFAMGVLCFDISFFNDWLTAEKTPSDHHSTTHCRHVMRQNMSSLTSHPVQASCISRTSVLQLRSGWGRCFRAGGWCPSPQHWSEAAGWRHPRPQPPLPGWGQNTQPGCRAASCSRHCTETHWTQGAQTHGFMHKQEGGVMMKKYN